VIDASGPTRVTRLDPSGLRGRRWRNLADAVLALVVIALISHVVPKHFSAAETSGVISASDVSAIIDDVNGQPAAAGALVLHPGPLSVRGWAAATSRDELPIAVDVVLDGAAHFPATIGLNRPDVARAFNAPAIAPSGFLSTIPASSIGLGAHEISIEATVQNGSRAIVSRHVRFEVQNH
jgi:hypothetical protein